VELTENGGPEKGGPNRIMVGKCRSDWLWGTNNWSSWKMEDQSRRITVIWKVFQFRTDVSVILLVKLEPRLWGVCYYTLHQLFKKLKPPNVDVSVECCSEKIGAETAEKACLEKNDEKYNGRSFVTQGDHNKNKHTQAIGPDRYMTTSGQRGGRVQYTVQYFGYT